MADSLITNLTLRSVLDGTEELPLNLPGAPDVDRKTTVDDVKTYAQGDLGTAAFQAATAFATAAQGGLADSAVQPGDLGTAAYADTGDFATAAQGAKADSALQPAEVKSANFTAANDGVYVVTASATVTDPSPAEGKGFQVIVRNGTATVGGTAYATAGLQIRRLYHSGAWANYVDVLTTDSRLSDARTPTAHAASHVNGTDDIQDATASQKGLMTAAYATKLDGIEAGADVTDSANVGSSIHGSTAKTTPVDGDTMPLIDSAASNVLKKVTWANIKATLKTYFDTLYQAAGSYLTSGGALGTPSSGTLTNCTGLPTSGLTGQVALANGGTGANLTDPNADRIMFWDDSAGAVAWLTAGSGLTITDTTITATGASGITPKTNLNSVTSTSTSLADVTGLTASLESGKTYAFTCMGMVQSSATTEGLGLAINGPSASAIQLNASVPTNASGGYTNNVVTAYDTAIQATSGTANTTYAMFYLTGFVTTTASGTFAIRFKAETGGANSVTIQPGAVLRINEV